MPYFDLSFQHAAPQVLRRMRRFGDPDAFLGLIASIRALAPTAGIRSNVICGFPGETEADVEMLCDFLSAADLDAIGVFGYSDEDGTEAAGLADQISAEEIEARRNHVADLADELVSQRAEARVGETVQVLVEEIGDRSSVGPPTRVPRWTARCSWSAANGRGGRVRAADRSAGDRRRVRERGS